MTSHRKPFLSVSLVTMVIVFASCRPIRQMLGGDTGITNKNVMIHVGMIEHRATQLCNLLMYGQLRVS